MRNERILPTLQYIRDLAENPLYCELEVGFRHGPLSVRETLQRYEDFAFSVKTACDYVLEALEDT